MMHSILDSSRCWSQRYESLRAHVLQPPHLLEETPLSLIALMNDGLAGWMRRWVDSTSPSRRAPSAVRASLTCPSSSGRQLQLTLLLAQMTASHLSCRAAQ